MEAMDLGGFKIDPRLVNGLTKKLLDMQYLDLADRHVSPLTHDYRHIYACVR